jgi:N-acetylneuraminic acid mutarotase
MRKLSLLFFLTACAVFLLAAAAEQPKDQPKIGPMPAAVSNNAVAALKGGLELYSVMGIGEKKTWEDITRQVYILRLPSGKWSIGPPVPGVAGRLGASAIGARGQVFVFGGYTVDGRGEETILPDVNSFVTSEKRWFRAEDIPVPVDSAMIGVTQNRYIYLVGGRSKNGPVNNVQVYDAQKNTWSEATPAPGTPVFGQAGSLAEDTIVYVDGAKKNAAAGSPYVNSDECWMGKIDHKNPNKIEWSKLPPHPGSARFGIVAGEEGHKILFSGGTTKPHKFNGLDYEGKPAVLSPLTFSYDLHSNKWEIVVENTFDVRADSRGMVSTPVGEMILGGMLADNTFSARIVVVNQK